MSDQATTPPPESKAIVKNPNFPITQKAIEKMLAFWPETVPGKARFTGIALSTALNDPKLDECSLRSKLQALATCARLGLVPDATLGHAYLVPFREKGVKQAVFIAGYKGLVTLAHRCGAVKAINAKLVYANDRFEYEDGTEAKIVHQPHWMAGLAPDPGPLVCGYVIATMPSGEKQHCVMSAAEIDKIKARSPAKNNGPWVTDEPAMQLKSVIRRASKLWPLSSENIDFAKAVDAGEEYSSDGDPLNPFDEQDIIDVEAEVVTKKAEPADGRTKV